MDYLYSHDSPRRITHRVELLIVTHESSCLMTHRRSIRSGVKAHIHTSAKHIHQDYEEGHGQRGYNLNTT